jgi:hypothetical protein
MQLMTLLYPECKLLVTRQQTLSSKNNYHLKDSTHTRQPQTRIDFS